MKPNRKRLAFKRKLVCVAVASCFTVMPAFANPIGASVASGQVGFAAQGSALTITNSPNAIINWQQFSISPGEITRFIQQSASSAVLNRVLGQDPSQILGSLLSNGRVFLVNPNGIVFGQGAVVDVAGLVASTLRLSDGDFLAGRLNFTNGVGAGGIDNQGTITAPNGGNIYLIAPDIRNSGLITSPQGEILLAAGHSVNLMDAANPDVQVTLSAPDSRAVNIGTLMAQSGRIGIYGALIGQQGAVNADTAVLGANGRIMLRATKDIILEPGSVTTASGTAGGVRDGGEIRIVADGTLNMRSGSQVRVDGGVDGGNGGFLELSGKTGLILRGNYSGRAHQAGYHNGSLLLDPYNIDISSAAGSSSGASFLTSGSGTILASDGCTASSGCSFSINPASLNGGWANVSLAATNDITVSSPIINANINNGVTGGSLTLTAGNNIMVGASIGTSSTRFAHDLTLTAGNNVNINRSIYLGNNTLALAADATIPAQGIVADGVGSVFIQPPVVGSTPVVADTLGNLSVTGAGLQILGYNPGPSSNAAPVTVNVGGSFNANLTGEMRLQAGNALPNTIWGLTDASVSLNVAGGDGSNNNSLTVGSLVIQGGSASACGGDCWSPGNADAILSATNNLVIVAAAGGVTIGGGNAKVWGASGSADAHANAELSAANLKIDTAGAIQAQGGNVSAVMTGNSAFRVTAAATAKITVANTLEIGNGTSGAASSVQVAAGSANAYANGSASSAPALPDSGADANASISAGQIILHANGLVVRGGGAYAQVGGSYSNSFASSFVSGTAVNRSANAEANATIQVTGDLAVNNGSGGRITAVQVFGGSAMAYAYAYGGSGSSGGSGGNNGSATVHANASITAGSLALSTVSLTVGGGGVHAQAGSSSSGAINHSATAEAKALLQVNGLATLNIGSGGLAVNGGPGSGSSCYPVCTALVYGAGGVNTATADRSALISITGAASLTVAGGGITVAGGSADAQVRGAGSNTATENADAAIQVTGNLDISDGDAGRITSALISGGYAWTDVHGTGGSGGASAFANASVTAGSLVLRTNSLTVKGGNTARAWAGSGSGNEVINQSATAESKALLQVNGSVTAMDIGSGGMLVEALCNCGTAQVYGAGGVNSATADRSAFVRVTGDLAALTVAGGGVTVRGGNATATAYGTSGANTATEYANAGIDVGGTLQTGAGGIAGGLTVQGGGAFGSGARAHVSGGSNQAAAYGGAEIAAGAVNITVVTGDLAISGGNATASASSGIGASADARALVTVTGAQVFNIAAGNVSLTGGSPAASGAGATAQANVLLSSQAGGNAVVLAASGNFINNAGVAPINLTGGGRWLVYSTDPASDTFGGLDSVNTAIWNATYTSKPPVSVAQTGNRYLFSYQPTLTFTSTSTSKVYGADATAAVAAAYGVSGLAPGVANAYLADSNATVFSGAPAVTSGGSAVAAAVSGSPYAITVAQGGLSALSGYAFAYQSSGLLTVNPLAVILSGSKVDDGTPTFIAGQLGIGNIVGSDVVSLSGGTADTADAVVGSNKPFVSFAGLALAGASAGNYTLTGVSGTGTITSAAPPPPPAPVVPAVLDNPVVVAALDFGNGETNDSAKVDGFVPTIFFGNEGEKEKKDDIPVCN